MSILNNPIYKTLTVSSGSASDTFSSQGVCLQFLAVPATSTTQYDVTITNDNNLDVFSLDSGTGTVNEFINLPFVGNYTLSISNATKDEDVEILLVVRNA